MNEIIKGYLSKFTDEFQDCKNMKEEEQFEHFINYITIKRDFLDDFNLDDIHTGGGMDNGIDGIAIIINNNLVSDIYLAKDIFTNPKDIYINFVFIQSKTSDSIKSGDMLKFLAGVYNLFKKSDFYNKNYKISEFKKIKDFLYNNSSDFSENPKLYLKYVYNGSKDTLEEINNHIKTYEEQFEQLALFSNISIEILDSNNIQTIYKEITLNVKKNIKLEKVVTIPQINSIQEAYIGIIPLSEFVNLVCDDNRIIKNLFYSNVRDFQGNTSVNKEIIETMSNKSESKYFGLYHNGITIVAKTLKKTGDSITLENFQIVNGCQTSHIIAENKGLLSNNEIEKMFIPIKLIATEDNNIINSVIKTTNRHNEVKKEAFESLEDFHKRLEEFYNAKNECSNLKIYYERRSKQYVYNDKIKKSNIITLAKQIRTYLSMFVEVPQSVHRYYGELLDAYRKNHNIFNKVNNKEHFELYHIASLTFVRLNAFMANNKIKNKYRPFIYHIILLFKLITARDLSIKSKKSYYEENCKKLYYILSNDNASYNYFSKCCEIIDKAIIGDRRPYYSLNRITEFTIKIKDICKKKI